MTKTARLAVVAVAAAMSLAACGSSGDDDSTGTDTSTTSSSTESSSSAASSAAAQYPDFKACMVSDTGGFNDHSFNETSLAGLLEAGKTYGVQTTKLQSNADSDYANNLKTLVKQKCDEITSVGYLLADATLAAAKANPNTKFAIIDNDYEGKIPANLKELTFATDQAAFLAGYLAAGMTKSGTVGTLGGVQIPSVTIYMDGFIKGVDQYNTDNSKEIKVLGWNGKKGSFSNDFSDVSKCKSIAQTQIQQGADILFPVAGGCGEGALQAAKSANDLAIWVDTDGYESESDYRSILLSSVVKRVDSATIAGIVDAASGKWNNKPYVGTLKNEGVSLAPYHDFDSSVPDELKSKIEDYQKQIIDGSFTVS
ncbi:MAG: BMP family ABC transporter substrate-binding protein [Nocardioides sp.]|uniref:BMP family lipoprotein n=1 Tax=Nocardioides sp. TaxID=35761 RepID=UPI0039E642BF